MIAPSLTYASAGVDIDAGNAMVEAIKPMVRATRRPGADAEIGGFGGLFDLKAAGFVDPVLVAANDGVGTKLRIAIESGILDTIGIDLVAMCVNDIVVQGAEPLFFLDYFATGKLDPSAGARIVKGDRGGVHRVGLRADRRRDGGDAGPLRRERFRPRRLRCRRRRARHAAAAGGAEGRRSRDRPAVVGRAFQRLFADPPHRRALGARLGRAGAVRAGKIAWPSAADADPALRQAAARGAEGGAGHFRARACHGRRVLRQSAARAAAGARRRPRSRRVRPAAGVFLARFGRRVEEREMLRAFNCGFGMVVFAAEESEPETLRALAGLSPKIIGRLAPRGAEAVATRGRLPL